MITEIKNTLEGINSRISEAEEWISELEDKMVEITSEEQNKVKRMTRTEDSLRENFWRDYSWKFPQHGKGNSQSSPRGSKSPIQDKPKEKHAKTHTNQANKD